MIALIVHGGAWNMPDDQVEAHKQGCLAALAAGWAVLAQGGTALDAVEAAVRVLEDDPTFDAGVGSFLNAIGEVELDAGIMDGASMRAGSVAAVQRVRHPISVARQVLESDLQSSMARSCAIRRSWWWSANASGGRINKLTRNIRAVMRFIRPMIRLGRWRSIVLAQLPPLPRPEGFPINCRDGLAIRPWLAVVYMPITKLAAAQQLVGASRL